MSEKEMDKVNLLNFDRKGMEAFFIERGEKPFRATQLLKWIYQEGVNDFAQMTNLSKSLRNYLTEHCCISAPEIVVEQNASDGTRKWLMRLRPVEQLVLDPGEPRALRREIRPRHAVRFLASRLRFGMYFLLDRQTRL